MSIELHFLGAGRPATGNKPSALKNIALNFKAMDWQLHSFSDVVDSNKINFVGGYHIDEIAVLYPYINYTIVPDWSVRSALYTLLHSPFSGAPVFITYTDTLFRKEMVSEISRTKSDAVFVIDSSWENRYSSRTEQDICKAETLKVNNKLVEFTGLIYLSKKSVALLREEIDINGQAHSGESVLCLLTILKKIGVNVDFYDIEGEWAEFNSPTDIANFILGTKADTLARLEGVVSKSIIGKQYSFTVSEWNDSQSFVIEQVRKFFGNVKLVVRSSSKAEDNWQNSNAGGFESILNVSCFSNNELNDAINKVLESYGKISQFSDQILVQEFISDVKMAGVVFTCTLESGAPYYRFNFDDITQSTESVTAGTHSDLRTVLVSKVNPEALSETAPELVPVYKAIYELEELLGFDKLDIEFAIDNKGKVHIFQVRPVVVSHDNYEIDFDKICDSLRRDRILFSELQDETPSLKSKSTIFANMPDWNPAEIIGTRPKPLAISLYQHLITNEVWATQRAEFGYKDVRPAPLLVTFSGQPYIDVRASFNSFIPKNVSVSTHEKLVTAYLAILNDNPNLHDKIEFEIAFTIWTPNLYKEACSRLIPYGVTKKEVFELVNGLKSLTREAFTRLDKDIESIDTLVKRLKTVLSYDMASIQKAFIVLDDCKRFGTLAFAHAARAGFVATTFLKYLVSNDKLTEERKLLFMNSFNTVTGQFEKDKEKYTSGEFTRNDLINKYGHLRPGTYEVSTPAYWENPEEFILPTDSSHSKNKLSDFEFNAEEKKAIKDLLNGLNINIEVQDFINYLVKATQQREEVKFKFTKNLSVALDLLVLFGKEIGLDRGEVSFLTYGDIETLRTDSSYLSLINGIIKERQNSYKITKSIELPPLISKSSHFYSFERHASLPNFVGLECVISNLELVLNHCNKDLKNKIVMISQADPGYDWLFGHGIAGLITKYGGANSHMAIRAAEIGLPAAIGVGEKLYDSLQTAKVIELNCLNQLIRVIE